MQVLCDAANSVGAAAAEQTLSGVYVMTLRTRVSPQHLLLWQTLRDARPGSRHAKTHIHRQVPSLLLAA